MRTDGLSRSFQLSLVLHAILLAAWWAIQFYANPHQASQRRKQVTWIEVAPPAPPARKREEPALDRQRIVQTETAAPSKEAAPDAYLGERTQTADRQTVSRKRETQIGKAAALARKKAKAAADAGAARGPLAKFGLAILPKDLGKASLSPDSPEWVVPAEALPTDYVRGVAESERTLLNTKEYVFFSYYQRIRQSLDRAWRATLRQNLTKLFRKGRSLAADMDHTTRTLVTLNGDGHVTDVKIVGESGTWDLDEAAISAFNKAGPFPNPPRGMMDAKSGSVQVRWDFVLRN